MGGQKSTSAGWTDHTDGSLHVAKVRVAGFESRRPLQRKSWSSIVRSQFRRVGLPTAPTPMSHGSVSVCWAGSADDPVVESSIRQRSAGHIVGTSQCVIRLTNCELGCSKRAENKVVDMTDDEVEALVLSAPCSILLGRRLLGHDKDRGWIKFGFEGKPSS